MRASVRLAAIGLSLVALAGCESAIIGSECRAPLVRCGHYCVDLASDGLNCGACGNACALGCVSGRCVMGDASRPPDAGDRDAGRDAGHDGGLDASNDAGTDAFVVADVGIDAATFDGGGPRCGLGEILCGASCVDPGQAGHCGGCAQACATGEVCDRGVCGVSCAAGRMLCGSECVDVSDDARHCGDCATDCGLDSCVAGGCAPRDEGHLVVIGHDYELRRIEMSHVVANAVLLPARSPVRVLTYPGDASAAAITGTQAAIAEAAGGRSYTLTTASSAAAVPVALERADTFLVYAQVNATDDTLRTLGYAWATALGEFLDRGGVLVVLDAPSLRNAGAYQIVDVAGLFHATAISEMVSPRLVAATGRESDAVLAGVAFPYAGERHTVRISTLDPDVIVTTGSSGVVFHRVVTH